MSARDARTVRGCRGTTPTVYAEPKRLETLGLLVGEREAGRTRERTRYRLTEAGAEACRRWLPEPPGPPHVASEAVTKVVAADLGDERDGVAAVTSLRPELQRMLAAIEQAQVDAVSVPHRTRYLLLNHRLARRMLEAHLAWVDEVEQELEGGT